MTKPLAMTYQEEFGPLPTRLLRLYRANNVSPADHDQILLRFDCAWGDDDIPWSDVLELVEGHCKYGQLRLPTYF